MKLYVVAGSPNSRKVLAVVNHLALDIELEYLDFLAGELRSADYLGINPNAMVPALVDGPLRLWESNAVMQYLADCTPGQTLWPSDPRVRADVSRWQCWELAHYNKALGTLAFEAVAKPAFMKLDPDAALVAWARRELGRYAPVLDAHLKGRRYAVGDAVTLADYALIHVEAYKAAVPFDWSPYPHLNAYYERIAALPAWAKTAPASHVAVGRRPA
jgi:glutathione S-transferase